MSGNKRTRWQVRSFYFGGNPMTAGQKRLLRIIIAVVICVAVGLFIVTPGWLLGGVRGISAPVSMRVVTHERAPIYGTAVTGFISTDWQDFVLSDAQTEQLSRRLRRSWYLRRSPGALVYRVAEGVYEYHTFHVSAGVLSLTVSYGGNVSRQIGEAASTRARVLGGCLADFLWEILEGTP
jgi:hypothetical protein